MDEREEVELPETVTFQCRHCEQTMDLPADPIPSHYQTCPVCIHDPGIEGSMIPVVEFK